MSEARELVALMMSWSRARITAFELALSLLGGGVATVWE